MKQTLEEAAKQGAEGYNIIRQNIYKSGFKDGAEWHSKQSPWISVEERLPEPGKEVLLYVKNSIQHYVIGWLRRNKGYNKGMWALSNGWVEDKDITHWMPIPPLESNGNGLERKEE